MPSLVPSDTCGRVPLPRVVEATYDFWFEIAKADDELDPGEEAKLNLEGLVYYVVVRPYSPSDTFWPDSAGFITLNDARRGAASMLAGPLDWSRSSEFPVHGSS